VPSPTPWIALLRGVNVGGHRKLPMAQLRTLVEGAGYGNVRTYIQSGNVVFTATIDDPGAAARSLEALILAETGIDTTVTLRSRDQLAAVIAAHPFVDRAEDPKHLHVSFCVGDLDDSGLRAADPARWAPDEVATGTAELYLHCPRGMGRSKLTPKLIERLVGGSATTRNWRTVNKLLEMCG
jgi:uncharacterized protein (DUF1697 family)